MRPALWSCSGCALCASAHAPFNQDGSGHSSRWCSSAPIVSTAGLGTANHSSITRQPAIFSSLWQSMSVEPHFSKCKGSSAMHLQVFLYDTFRRHARTYVEPAIINKWKASQDDMLLRLSGENTIIGGDMRADSPGHSAKFGSYTVMDLKTNNVIDVQLVQSNEVGGSYHMEKEGLKRSLALLEERRVTLDCIVTDRHPQIQKFLRETGINQYYDVWHMEKGTMSWRRC
ncbi:uncharacterized protein LOC130381219 isoform X2 [Gadus chalcogrammus]|uniref:uncharacterized protein LOC130381219 isoform X2 n=1 Tax=Gadus chalcogrammus TaxID=1042646 RepID=UPI0024C2B9A6|nr:uncharacterized protein LOC130381219 isoform X2 [Gadus chalcogrammus]